MIIHDTRTFPSIFLILMMSLTLQFCSSQKESLNAEDIAKTYERGMSYYEKENYLKAEETFTFIIYNDPGGAYADDAQYYLAETYFARGEYLLAINEYDRLIRRMKNSTYVEDAFWRKTESYCELSPDYRLEKDMTEKALRFLYDFVEIYPESKHLDEAQARITEMREKLAKKLLEAGKLYDTLREYESAIYYYNSLIEEYSDTKLYAAARLGKAGDMVALEKWEEARELLNSIAMEGKANLSPKELARMKLLGSEVIEKTKPSKE
ncbi:MAG: outer membrane protein assembly factor BamD [Candidatus Marinimicrobia bacterium]|nr:outer membrane protein assembly factor BamD [Candidatus Neomarinimicrobiota bacterium]